MTKLNFARDVQGFNSYAPEFSANKFSATLAAAGNDTITVPSSFTNWVAGFSYQAASNIWVSVNGTAAAPAGATFAATSSQFVPGSLKVKAGDTINIKNTGAAAADVGVILYVIS